MSLLSLKYEVNWIEGGILGTLFYLGSMQILFLPIHLP